MNKYKIRKRNKKINELRYVKIDQFLKIFSNFVDNKCRKNAKINVVHQIQDKKEIIMIMIDKKITNIIKRIDK